MHFGGMMRRARTEGRSGAPAPSNQRFVFDKMGRFGRCQIVDLANVLRLSSTKHIPSQRRHLGETSLETGPLPPHVLDIGGHTNAETCTKTRPQT